MKIGTLLIPNNLILAPMAGFTDNAFRTVCKQCGAGVLLSEMVSAKGLYYKDKKTAELMAFSEEQRPFGIQIFGSEPEILAYAAKVCEQKGADFIDINMGCPTPKIVSNGDGSALLKNPPLAGKCAAAVVDAVSVPVTVKIRLGWDDSSINAPEVARILESAGAAAITVHGRTRAQMYAPSVRLEEIRRVVESVSIPVIGNGDITDGISAKKMLTETGCQGLMIGRGAVGNPFVFREIDEYFKTGSNFTVSLEDKIGTAIRHLELLVADKGEHTGIKEARKHIACYLKGLKGSHNFKIRVFQAETLTEMTEILKEVRATCL